MWKHYKSISLGLVALAYFASAQGIPTSGFPTSSGTSIPQAAQASASAPAGGMFESNTFLEMANRVFDPSSDSMDFENGSFEWKGKNFNLFEQRAFRSRFERFLLASPTEEETQYAQLMADIIDQLALTIRATMHLILGNFSSVPLVSTLMVVTAPL